MRYYCLSSTKMTSTVAAVVFVLFLTHGALADEDASTKTVINVDLYYEALCGDSIKFVKHQLIPSYPKLKDHLKINFIPYGKATDKQDPETKRWTFVCQHGPAECKGNGAQACALKAIAMNEQPEDRQQLSVDLVGCVMSSTSPSTAVTRCGVSVGLSPVTRQSISDCKKSTLSDDLLAANGAETRRLQPALMFVPTIVINGVYSSENQSAALEDFEKVICGLIPQNEKPATCQSS